jgi:putative permease
MLKKISLPFFVKLACTLISILALGVLAYLGQTILVPLILGLLLTMLLLPVSQFLEQKLKFPRAIGALTSILLFLAALTGLFTLLGTQMTTLANEWPAFSEQIMEAFRDLQIWVAHKFGINTQDQMAYINDTLSNSLGVGTSIIGKTIFVISAQVVIIFFVFLYTFFLLLYRTHILSFFIKLFNNKHKNTVIEVANKIQRIVKKYIIGLMLQMLIVTTLTFIAFTLIGMKYSFFLALITGIFNVIPYIGLFIAILLSAILAFASATSTTVLLVIVALVVIHLIDSNYVIPKVIGSKVKINSLIAFLGLIIGEMIWGITGMFLSIPMIAIIKIVFDHIDELKPWGYLLGEEEEEDKEVEEVENLDNEVVLEPK